MTTLRHNSDDSSTLALSTEVTFLRRLRAVSKATLAIRRISSVVYTSVLKPRSSPFDSLFDPFRLPKVDAAGEFSDDEDIDAFDNFTLQR